MKILVHTCCANCLIYPLKVLKEKGFAVHSFFYNHIHPYTEFIKRLETLKIYTEKEGINLIIRKKYELENFLQKVVFREGKRCYYCYFSRLEATAKLAKKSKFEFFTTTLLYSKHQKHELIIQICESLEKKYGIKFYYEDFRKGWKYGIEKSKELNLYRQQYCGCIYSEKERFLGKNENIVLS